MSGDSSAATSSPEQSAAAPHPPHFGDNKGIKFHIQTGNQKWACVLQDRGSYERKRAARRQNSGDSMSTESSSASDSSQ